MDSAGNYKEVYFINSASHLYVTGFGKINHFFTFDTSNIYDQNNALYSTSQRYSEYRVSMYTELPENL